MKSSTIPARHTDPTTSHDAARKAVKRRPRVREAVLLVLTESGPLTHEQLVSAYNQRALTETDWPLAAVSSIRTRCNELLKDKLVEPVPDQVGSSSMGNKALLWRAVAVQSN